MTNDILNECINAIHDEKATGFSFVNSLMSVLMKYNKVLHLDNIVIVWRVSIAPNCTQEFRFYSNNQTFNIDSLDVVGLSECISVLTSEDKGFTKYRRSYELYYSHIVALPINHFAFDDSLLPTRGVMLLFSQFNRLNISKQQILILHNLINIREPKIFTSSNVVNAFKSLSSKSQPDELSYLECYKYIGESLDIISNKSSNYFSNSGLRHYSLWQHVIDNNGDPLLIKEFNRNTYNGTPHKITNTILRIKDRHFLIDTIRRHPVNNDMEATILRCISFEETKGSFKKDDRYFMDLGLCEKDCTIIVVAVGKGDSCMLSCLYIKNIVYSVLISKNLILHYIQEIGRRVFEENNRTKNLILNNLTTASLESNSDSVFYLKASHYLTKANEATDCLIYMVNEKGKLVLKSENNPCQNDVYSDDEKKIFIPERYSSDAKFVRWIEKLSSREKEDKGYIDYLSQEGFVRSAMAIQVSPNGHFHGLIILINKNHTPSNKCVFYHNTFILDNYAITHFCGLFLIQYQQLQNSISNKNYLLHKLRHEIPSNTEAIKRNTQRIKECLNEPELWRNYIYVILNNINLSSSRIYLLAQFFSAVGFPPEKFAENKKKVNLNHFLNSYVEIFRAEGVFRNVDIYFDIKNDNPIIFVSNYYLLALVNVITNAIRYAANGTCVYVEASSTQFIVTDIGIPIKKSDMDLIYNEGFRSEEAKATNGNGMGYGLYLSKMILESHGSKISAQCERHCEENLYLQKAICEYIPDLSETEKKKFLYAGLDDFNKSSADDLYVYIKNNNYSKLDYRFKNNKKDLMRQWLDYIYKYNCVFIDMEHVYFTKEVYKVTFTITF